LVVGVWYISLGICVALSVMYEVLRQAYVLKTEFAEVSYVIDNVAYRNVLNWGVEGKLAVNLKTGVDAATETSCISYVVCLVLE
jgi:hypothetical protein